MVLLGTSSLRGASVELDPDTGAGNERQDPRRAPAPVAASAHAAGAGTPPAQPAFLETPRHKVVLHALVAGSEILPLLRAELADLGLEIVEYPPSADSQEKLDGPGADFGIVVRHESLEVWAYDRKTRRITLREVFANVDGSALETRTVVLHAVELLRWRLRDVEPRTREVPTQRLDVVPSLARPARHWFVGFGPVALHSLGGTKPSIGFTVDLTWRQRALGLRLLGGTLLWPNTLSRPEGVLEATPRFIGLEAVLFATTPATPWEAELAAGIAFLSVRLRGTTQLSLQTHEDRLLTAAPTVEGRLGYALGDTVTSTFNVLVMAPLRSDVMQIDEREVGRYADLILALGVGLRASLR